MVELASMREGHHAEKTHGVTNQQQNHNVSMLDQIDLALASRLVGEPVEEDLLAGAQRALEGLRRPAPSDAEFLISLLRLRGFSVSDDDGVAVLAGRACGLSPLTQELSLIHI